MFALVDARGYSMFPLGSTAHREALNWRQIETKRNYGGGVGVVGGHISVVPMPIVTIFISKCM